MPIKLNNLQSIKKHHADNWVHKFKADGENRSDHKGGAHLGRLPEGGVAGGDCEEGLRSMWEAGHLNFWEGKARLFSFLAHLFS